MSCHMPHMVWAGNSPDRGMDSMRSLGVYHHEDVRGGNSFQILFGGSYMFIFGKLLLCVL